MTAIPTWFDTVERRSALLSTARAWDRTPFFANSAAAGAEGGVDCVNLANAVFATCGCIECHAIPPQVMDAGQHASDSPLIAAFETWPHLRDRFARLPDCSPANLLPGDVLCFMAGRVPHHCGILLLGDEVLHALSPTGVHRTQLRAAIRGVNILGRLAAAFRPLP